MSERAARAGASEATPAEGCGADADSGERFAVTLRIDGRELTLKAFLHDLIGGSVAGLAGGLRGGEDASHIELSVRRRSGPPA